MGIVGSYTLHLYCDATVLRVERVGDPAIRATCRWQIEVGGEVQTMRQAMSRAVADGWTVRQTDKSVRCPACAVWEKANKRKMRKGLLRTV